MRLFAAIRLSPAAEDALVYAQDILRRAGRGSFPRREMLHLTLAFLGEVEDIACCALYLASDAARFVTGQDFVIDGGAMCR